MQGQSVGHAETKHVLRESRRGSYAIARETFQLAEFVDFELQLFAEELLQARQPKRTAQAHHRFNLGVAMRIREISQGALHFADELVQYGADRGENLLQIGRLGSFISLVKARVK